MKISQSEKGKPFMVHLHEASKAVKLLEIESRKLVSRDGRRSKEASVQ